LNIQDIPLDLKLEDADKLVIKCGVIATRNIQGFPFSAAMTRAMRGDMDFAVKGALIELEGRFRGKFYEVDEVPNEDTPAFDPPAPLTLDPLLEGATAEDWPRGRSVWCSQQGAVFVLLHGRDHVTIAATTSSTPVNIWTPFVRVVELLQVLRGHLAASRVDFAFDPHLGFLGPDPAKLGIAMEFFAKVKLPFLGQFPLLDTILTRLRLVRNLEPVAEKTQEGGGGGGEEGAESELRSKISAEMEEQKDGSDSDEHGLPGNYGGGMLSAFCLFSQQSSQIGKKTLTGGKFHGRRDARRHLHQLQCL